MSTPYENLVKRIEEEKRKRSKVGRVSQHILLMKSVWSELEEDDDKCKTFRDKDDTFGFSERLVNRMLQHAYNEGQASVVSQSTVEYRRIKKEVVENVIRKLKNQIE